MRIWLSCLVLFILFSKNRATAQYSFQQIDNSGGLSNSCVNSIWKDSDNLIWFGTWDGLNYYDGSNVHVFNYAKTDAGKNSIASNVIYEIKEDRQRNIWIATVEGVSRFNKNTGEFSNYFYNPKAAISNGYTIAINLQGEVFAVRRNSNQLLLLNRQNNRFEKFSIKGLERSLIYKMVFDDRGNFWVLKDNGLLECYNRISTGFKRNMAFGEVTGIDNLIICNRRIFYATKSELFQVDENHSTKSVLKLPHEVRAMAYYQNNYILAWASKGIGEYSSDFKKSSFLPKEYSVLQNVRIASLMNDDAMLWLGSDGNGAMKVARRENYFGLMNKQSNGQSFHVPVRAFCNVNNDLWVGTKGNGIVTIKNLGTQHATFSTIKSFKTDVDLLDNCVYSIKKGNDGLVYIGSDAPGVTLYDTIKNRFIKWQDIPESKNYDAFGSVHCVLTDADGSVWMGLNDGGLVHLALKIDGNRKVHIKSLEQFKYTGDSRGPGSNVIYSLAAGSDGIIWVGCRYGGLSRFDKSSKRFTTIKAFSYDQSLSNNDVLSLYLDQSNRLWVGTSFGLNWVNEADASKLARPVFKQLNTYNGLPNNTIHAIEEDRAKNIWISTNKGLARVNPSNRKIVQFKLSDGLQSDEFSDNASWVDISGRIFFGGIYGFNYFLPQDVHISTEKPRLLITDLQFAGKSASEKGLQVLSENGPVISQHYDLNPQNNYFELNIRPITYIHSQKCQYAYYLEGNDKDWHFIGNDEKIIYNNLSPGNYTLRIKWSNGEGAWTKDVQIFTITVKQFFWLTPFAFAIYILFLGAAGYLYYRYRRNKFLITHELKMEHLLREKEENLHQEQLNFFTNIAHELQTPLTLILGSLERYLYKNKTSVQAKTDYFLTTVKQEASRLHYLVLQLLEFRKAESGFLKNHYSHLDISALTANISGLFKPLAQPKQLNFSTQIDLSINLWIDKDKIEKVLYNLLSNAFKHSPAGESVVVSVKQLLVEDRIEIIVANSGIQLDESDLRRLFDRFYVVETTPDTNKASSGIGLAFTRQLVQLMDGIISVSCENNWISFRVLLPLTVFPANHQLVTDIGDKTEKPSFLLQSITNEEAANNSVPIAENNKRALVKSFELEDRKMILVVEDEEKIRYLLKDILSEQYIVYEASTGKEALEIIHRIVPDMIISDVMMPDLDGLQLCDIVKSTPATCYIPFVILSARGTIEQKTEGYESGADAYIPKPFQTEHLLVRVQKLLEYREKLHAVFAENSISSHQLAEEDINESDKHFIDKVVALIEENINEELDGAFLENAMNLSRMQLYRKIKTLSNMTPTELIRHVRLQKSAMLLKTSDLTVSEIFYRTGFNNKTYFFREFKKVYNCSPNAYRAAHRLPALN
ncbi:response regulator [Pedobacter sp. HMF7647]|uniref:histidine kinase n=1 Tax=Hufsiella arboris TaxID=2695275 RepID=A0A7K1Y867_9SPHI|nr:hybrid sensor histidine kinase/response regulator transcription factor [Hufsiella arboris]MXV50561.1 response regulator [Hufsiella arboris]